MNPQYDTSLRASHCARGDLTECDVAEMRGLLGRYFEGVDESQFAMDLGEKSHVLRVWMGGDLAGFSTLLAYRTVVAGEPLNILYSGDTIMSPACWSSPILARGWIAMVTGIRASMPAGRCFWLLLSAGFRTYRFLPVFWRGFWPRFDAEDPDEIRALRDAIARERFGGCYDPVAGVVRFALPHRLSGALAVVPDGRRDDPHVAYFLQQNPQWREGDELVCLAEVDQGNLTRAGRRMIREL
jgi:hypothetical protein